MAIVTPTDRPKSVRNRCEIEVLGGVFVVSRCFFEFFCRCRGFYHRTGSDLFLFVLLSYSCGQSTHGLSTFRNPTFRHLKNFLARRGGVELAGWTVDREIRVRFPAYLTAFGPSDGKDVKDVFERPGARVGIGSVR